MKRTIIKCPYCGAKASLRPSSAVYKDKARDGEHLYLCDRYPVCNAYVGAHKHSLKPMGTLANGDLRNKRIKAHKAFNILWTDGSMKKHEAYQWMSGKFSLRSDQAHIAMFSEYMCDQLIKECQQVAINMKLVA